MVDTTHAAEIIISNKCASNGKRVMVISVKLYFLG